MSSRLNGTLVIFFEKFTMETGFNFWEITPEDSPEPYSWAARFRS